MQIDYRLTEIPFDKRTPPVWGEKVNRWHQLDGESFCLAQATYENLDFFEGIDRVFVVGAEGSTPTDRKFVTDRKFSPSHFVHTLPNVRSLSFSLISGFEGEVFCLAGASKSLMRTLSQMIQLDSEKSSLVININQHEEIFLCDFYKVGTSLSKYKLEVNIFKNIEVNETINDLSFRNFLTNSEQVTMDFNHVGFRKIV
ncbi:hypothetical protein A9Q84_01255 [Halobacteriovorax marinus]|uniref:Uncharacterized protein n=1 Tax=Halobacteriovorax marinus TaxID=97084 RepID=A0A1Y5FCC8_9BACT|nr:hypothetical protein A9Q84_01255 [Halobacteriovorax marinus]